MIVGSQAPERADTVFETSGDHQLGFLAWESAWEGLAAWHLPSRFDGERIMFHPTMFQVNEAWIVFRLNDAVIHTERDGDVNCLALMDAGSCFILCTSFVPAGRDEPTPQDVQAMFREAQAHKNKLPRTLIVPGDQFNTIFPQAAEGLGIKLLRVPEGQLYHHISEARSIFREHFSGGVPDEA